MQRVKKKIILDLCGGTGAWSEPYRKAGYDVRLITFPDFDVTETVVDTASKVFIFGNNGKIRQRVAIQSIHGILAAPPCTMFSLARRTAKTPPDFAGAMKIVGACLNIVWQCRTMGNLKWWALENPVGLLRQFLGKPSYTFEQWWFGKAKNIKRTDLWGYFNEPRRLRNPVKPTDTDVTWQSPKKPQRFDHLKLNRSDIRAITPAGFAQAFFKANP